MLSSADIREHLARVSYKPGWRFEAHDTEFEGPFVRILVDVPDSYNPGEATTLGINSIVAVNDTDELDRWLINRIIRIESHEAREFYKRDGKIIFDPHSEGEPYHV